MKRDPTSRSGIIAYVSISVFVALAAMHILLIARFDSSVHNLIVTNQNYSDTWRRIAFLARFLTGSPAVDDLPINAQAEIKQEMRALVQESEKLDHRADALLSESNSHLYALFYRDRLKTILAKDVKPAVKRYVGSLAATPDSMLAARFTSLDSIDAILLMSGRALDTLRERERELIELQSELADRRAPVAIGVLSALMTAIWLSWFWLLKPSIAMARDREERILAEEERLRITLESIGDGVLVADANGCLELLNPAAEKILGYPMAEVKGKRVGDFLKLFRSIDRVPLTNPVELVLASGEPIALANGKTVVTKLGDVRLIADAATPIRYASGKIEGVIVVFRDVTDEYALREDLLRSDKQRAVGALAGGMAHEFNNGLAIISGAFELLNASALTNGSETAKRHIAIIEEAIKRSKSLTNRLLAIGQRAEIPLAPVDLTAVIDDVVEILRRTTDRSIEIQAHYKDDNFIRTTFGDAAALQSMFLNLGLNSIQSIDSVGKIDVMISPSDPPRGLRTDHTHFVKITWSDNGRGIASKDISHIFEPFYTTKRDSGGSGLGLSVIQSVIAMHSGRIDVRSEIGIGTAFDVFLPVTSQITIDQPRMEADAEPENATASNFGVLIVDDEPSLLEVLVEYLSMEGYRTFSATNGHNALEIFQRHGAEIDLVVLDMSMPGLSGPEVAAKLLHMKPNCKIVVSTGYTKAEFDAWNPANMVYLKKPYELSGLVSTITELLSRDPGAST